MPLGGIGTGSIALCGDGSLRQWQIHNQVNHLACIPHSFFAVRVRQRRADAPPVARILQSSALYDSQGIPPPPTSNDHVVPTAHRKLLRRLPGVDAVEFIGEYPIAELTYHDPALPVHVCMEAFNPFVPLNAKDSGLPVILFNLTVSNPTDQTLDVSTAATLQNAVGWDGVVPIFDARCAAYGGNFNTLVRTGHLTTVSMSTMRLPEDDDGYGSMALGVLDTDATYLTQWDELDTFWEDYVSDGHLNNIADTTPSASGHTWDGALAASFALEAGKTRTVCFILAWHFPNRYVNYSQKHLISFSDPKTKFWIGNQYSHWFRSALDVAEYTQSHMDRLSAQTRQAREIFFDSTLPSPLMEAVTSQMSILRSPTCFWAEDGRLYGFEGCAGVSTPHTIEPIGGCCPLNCTHVWNYEMALARLFPSLERTMRETEWDIQQHPSGYLPHRVLLPLYLPRPWNREIDGPRHPALDGLLGAILKTYREYRAEGDIDWLLKYFPSVRRALDYVWTAHDPGRTGVIEGEQPNTYDVSIFGANTFIGTLYLAALRAVAALAQPLGDEELAEECQMVFEHGREALDTRLWNGEYFIQDADWTTHPEQNWGTGCHADQLFGQWWAHRLGLGYVLEPAHVRRALQSTVLYNLRENFRGHVQRPRVFVTDDDQGLLMCTWPHGERPATPTLYSDEVWTGVEYEVAALLLDEGEIELGLRIVAAVRARYDGRKQNPWNEIECGDHYVRALSSWALLEAAMGYAYDAGAGEIEFKPRITPERFRAPFFTSQGWGSYAQQIAAGQQECSLRLAYGTLRLNALTLGISKPDAVSSVSGALDDQPVVADARVDSDRVSIRFPASLELDAGQTLTIRLNE